MSHPGMPGHGWGSRRCRLITIAATTLACIATGASVAEAIALPTPDPNQVQFTLEGCRLPAGETLPNTTTPAYAGQYICDDADYTTGNLGKRWNELDLVPHRLTASAGTAQTYAVTIAADNFTSGHLGYDVISVPTVNAALSSPGCAVTAGPQSIETPGQGGADKSIYRVLTITQPAGSTCVFDYYQRLALGSHEYPGSSLHSNLLNQNLTTSGIGSKEVSIPVKEILPQGLSKTMTATTGSTASWNVTKDSAPAHLQFDTCATNPASHAQGVTITVNWTKTTVDGAQVTTVSNITLDNPASREITATVQDKIYEGTSQVTPVGVTYDSGAVVVGPNSTRTVTDTQTFPATPGVTHYNDVATATYTDPVVGPGVPILGTTTASAGADVVAAGGNANDPVTISDTEQMTGASLTFAIDSVSLAGGTFAPAYTPGATGKVTGPITWTLPGVTAGGSVVFQKTVSVAPGQVATTGTLADVAKVVDAGGAALATANAATSITALACPVVGGGSGGGGTPPPPPTAPAPAPAPAPATTTTTITGQKFDDLNGNGARDANEPGLAGVTIYLDVDGDGTFGAGEPSAVTGPDGSYTISVSSSTTRPGSYLLREVLPAGQVCTAPAGLCAHTIVVGTSDATITGQDFGNTTPVAGPVTATSTPPVTPPAVAVKDTKVSQVLSGRAALYGGPKRCVRNNFVAAVTGRQIAKVQFYVDNRPVATRTKRVRGRYSYTIKASSLSFAVHKLTAKVTYVAAARTKAKTMSFTFSRCAKAAVSKFTG